MRRVQERGPLDGYRDLDVSHRGDPAGAALLLPGHQGPRPARVEGVVQAGPAPRSARSRLGRPAKPDHRGDARPGCTEVPAARDREQPGLEAPWRSRRRIAAPGWCRGRHCRPCPAGPTAGRRGTRRASGRALAVRPRPPLRCSRSSPGEPSFWTLFPWLLAGRCRLAGRRSMPRRIGGADASSASALLPRKEGLGDVGLIFAPVADSLTRLRNRLRTVTGVMLPAAAATGITASPGSVMPASPWMPCGWPPARTRQRNSSPT